MKPLLKKAVFPVAGLGTRFLPATKASPKEMLPIVDKPLIQYAVEEAVSAGITELIFVTSGEKRAIEDHFDSHFELEYHLQRQNKTELLHMIQNIVPKGVHCIYVRQPEPLGLGHAVWCAKSVIGNEPFAVLLADDLIDGRGSSCLQQMLEDYRQHRNSLVAIQSILPQETQQYGVVALAASGKRSAPIQGIVEKPSQEDAPSLFGVVGRYILNPSVLEALEGTARGRGGEIQLTDAIAQTLNQEQVHAFQFEGTRYDCGSKLGYLMATVEFALKHQELGKSFSGYLQYRFNPERVVI